MKQVSYGGKYSLSASRAHHSHLQSSFVVGDAYMYYMRSKSQSPGITETGKPGRDTKETCTV